MKRILCALLVALMMLSTLTLVGCNKEPKMLTVRARLPSLQRLLRLTQTARSYLAFSTPLTSL